MIRLLSSPASQRTSTTNWLLQFTRAIEKRAAIRTLVRLSSFMLGRRSLVSSVTTAQKFDWLGPRAHQTGIA